jgi:NAD(P)H-dependent flavin oxidoreductase YrpB (nitropropane dioxygenase family)
MNQITQHLQIKYPIIQQEIIWISEYKLASAVSTTARLKY